jgi:hypothetical protein
LRTRRNNPDRRFVSGLRTLPAVRKVLSEANLTPLQNIRGRY